MPNFTINQTTSLFSETFTQQIFGDPMLVGIFVIIVFIMLLFKSRASADLYPVVLMPLVTVLAKFGYLPAALGSSIWLVAGIVLYLAIKKMMVRG